MNKLLIIGAGMYACVAYDIAIDMGIFHGIDFIDDCQKITPSGLAVKGTSAELQTLLPDYESVVVAIGNPQARLTYLQKIRDIAPEKIVSLVSPKAHVSASAKIAEGCIIEPMALVHTLCVLGCGCLIGAGAVINHASVCGDVVQVDCNATVEGYATVPDGFQVESGQVFKKNLE